MSSSAATPRSLPSRLVLADALPVGRTRDVALVVGAAGLVGLAAQVSVPLPFTPVPLTLQTFAVLLTGAALGTGRALAALTLYLLAGAAGLPWFAGGGSGVGGPSFGYILGFVLAATVVGALARRGVTRSPLRTALAMVVGTVLIYALGVPWLMVALDVDLGTALELGVVPFLVGDGIKALAAAGLLPAAWRLVERPEQG